MYLKNRRGFSLTTTTTLTFVIGLCRWNTIGASSLCPDLNDLRSDVVRRSWDETRYNGSWYEIAYHDIAQTGASCQRFENIVNEKGETGFQQKFQAKYGPIPFGQTYRYDPIEDVNGTVVKGRYTTYLEGAKVLLQLPAVMVDVRTNNQDDNDEGPYQQFTQFICKEEAGVLKVTELRIAARTKTISDDLLNDLKENAKQLGVPGDLVDSLKKTDHSKCNDS